MIEYVYALAGLLTLAALARGPTFADRSLAAGAFTSITVIILLLFAVRTHGDLYLDISIVMTFMSFVGTLAIARYVRDNK
jgi:multicomponent Na+:H+ antiporter subunit F